MLALAVVQNLLSAGEQAAHQFQVNLFQFDQVVHWYLFVNFVNGAVVGADLHNLNAIGCDKAAIGGAAGG